MGAAGKSRKAGAPADKQGMLRHLCMDIEWMVVSDEPGALGVEHSTAGKLRRVLLLQARPFDAPDDSPMPATATQGKSSSYIERWREYDRAGINAQDAKKRFESEFESDMGAGQGAPPLLQ